MVKFYVKMVGRVMIVQKNLVNATITVDVVMGFAFAIQDSKAKIVIKFHVCTNVIIMDLVSKELVFVTKDIEENYAKNDTLKMDISAQMVLFIVIQVLWA
jgi:hypothetical protein